MSMPKSQFSPAIRLPEFCAVIHLIRQGGFFSTIDLGLFFSYETTITLLTRMGLAEKRRQDNEMPLVALPPSAYRPRCGGIGFLRSATDDILCHECSSDRKNNYKPQGDDHGNHGHAREYQTRKKHNHLRH